MNRRLVATAALAGAIAIPGVALAHGKPDQPGAKKTKPPVSWVLKGTVTAYTAATEAADGSITVTVTSANRRRADLLGDTLTFVTKASTKVVLADGAIDVGEKVIVKLKAPRATAAEDIDTFVPRQVVDPADSEGA